MTAAVLDEAAVWEAFAAFGRAVRAVWDHIVTAIRQVWPTVRRWVRRYGRGPYSSPARLGIDGHAYARRRRARVRRS